MARPSAESLRSHDNPLPVDLITRRAMATWLRVSKEGVAKHLHQGEFEFERRDQPGVKGAATNHYTWQAFAYVAAAMGVPDRAVPILWDELPTSRELCTSEQTSYARAVQIMLLPEQRTDVPRIMTRQIAVRYLLAAAEVRQHGQ